MPKKQSTAAQRARRAARAGGKYTAELRTAQGGGSQPDHQPPPEAQAAGSRSAVGEPLGADEVTQILHISPLLLPAILGSNCRFYRAPDGAIEQRGDGDALVCRWEQVEDGAIHQVVYDRDGVEDTRLLTSLTALTI